MTSHEPDPHLRPDHPYPTLPDGVRICDDAGAAGDFFFYRERELVVHAEDLQRTKESLHVLGVDRNTRANAVLGRAAVVRLQFTAAAPIDTIDLFRRLRFDVSRTSRTTTMSRRPRDRSSQQRCGRGRTVVGLQYHTKWGAGSTRPPTAVRCDR
jgi:hypothetical protein